MQVFLHPGFHKTGTTSAQAFLHENRELIWPRAALVLPKRIRDVSQACFDYAETLGAFELREITRAMRAFLADMPLNPNRRMLISAENLLGRMPLGLRDTAYPGAVNILSALIDGFAGLGWPVEVTLYLSTRERTGWVESIWAHQARKTTGKPFTRDLDDFRAAMAPVSLEAQLAEIRAGLPDVALVTHDVASFNAMRFGAGQPFVDFLNLPNHIQDQFVTVERNNVAPPMAVSERFIALNRSGLAREERTAAKRAVLFQAGMQEAYPDEEVP
ncbi:hypothetical protein C8J27_11255 [Rhodobacter aestuarii]|uniref:Sulfotransferase family protein n=1 Tax=Rhodobacter aestuarii TaxID=453582 RepID=A0A1N7Q9B6_9RHOB|nr:hypothetical protein [Rhodobacter aestuarii]PTV93774.1 hypothetical protein C8J27_11255 [Rhodobacter aestuarii]SIT19443.1 hypothetical protein SAMN05421580_11455 [Rhodobacter aestuarii]